MDGTTCRLNAWRPFDDRTLYYTLLHEELHGVVNVVLRNGESSEVSESREHQIMKSLDRRLI